MPNDIKSDLVGVPQPTTPNERFINSMDMIVPYDKGSVMALAYGNISMSSGKDDSEYRLQRLERGIKTLRRGRIVVSVPDFRNQSILSQTSGNNPFKPNIISGITYPPGKVPDTVATFANSNIRYPKSDLT